MREKGAILRRLFDSVELSDEALPLQSVIELLGDGRVLIENHGGVTHYCPEKIMVQVSFGSVCISGCELHLRLMTGQKLMIVGKIDGIEVIRGRCR